MYVYAIQSKGSVKIGKANVPEDRMRELQIGNPVHLILRMKIPCGNEAAAKHLERSLHCLLKKFHIRGEWFEYDPLADLFESLPACKNLYDMCHHVRSYLRLRAYVKQAKKKGQLLWLRGKADKNVELDQEFKAIVGKYGV